MGRYCRRKIALNEFKSVKMNYALRKHGYIPSMLESKPVPAADSARYLGIQLDS